MKDSIFKCTRCVRLVGYGTRCTWCTGSIHPGTRCTRCTESIRPGTRCTRCAGSIRPVTKAHDASDVRDRIVQAHDAQDTRLLHWTFATSNLFEPADIECGIRPISLFLCICKLFEKCIARPLLITDPPSARHDLPAYFSRKEANKYLFRFYSYNKLACDMHGQVKPYF